MKTICPKCKSENARVELKVSATINGLETHGTYSPSDGGQVIKCYNIECGEVTPVDFLGSKS